MPSKNEVHVGLVSRTSGWPDGTAMIDPEGKAWSYAEYYESGPYGSHRTDICLVNVEYANGTHEQFVVEPTASGEPSWDGAKRYLTRAQVRACRDENRRMLDIAATSPVYAKAMRL